MFGALLGKVTDIFDPRTVLVALLPTIAFWSAVAGLAGSQISWTLVQQWWGHLQSFTQVVFAVIAIAGMVVFALLLSSAEGITLRLYEGHWRAPLLSKVRAAGVRRQSRIRSQLKPDEKPSDFERRYRYFPVTDGDGDLMPTRLGNILRAAEACPQVMAATASTLSSGGLASSLWSPTRRVRTCRRPVLRWRCC